MNIFFSQKVNPDILERENINVERIEDFHFRITIDNNLDKVIKIVSQYEIKNMYFTEPSLEDIFLEFY